jgi:DNA end-binding protein Ku
MRSIWKGSITFGLVYIPVAVYPATREEKISFRQLRARDLSPIRYKKVAEADEKEVKSEEIVKGYEYEKGHWVTLEDEDFEKVKIESTHAIEITDFVDQVQIDPKFFYRPYFLEAQKGGDKPYALLYKALVDSGKVGIAKVVIASREYLAAVKPDGLFLILELMHFANEVLEPDSLKTPSDKEVSPKELDMAKALIESMASEWEPAKYKSQYREALMELIEDKARKRPLAEKPAAPRMASNVVDLVSVLQESLQKVGTRKAQPKSSGRLRSVNALVKQKRRSAAA